MDVQLDQQAFYNRSSSYSGEVSLLAQRFLQIRGASAVSCALSEPSMHNNTLTLYIYH